MKIRIADIAARHGRSFSAGMTATTIAIQLVVAWIVTCGNSSVSLAVGLLAAALGTLLGSRFATRLVPTRTSWVLICTGILAVASWCIAPGLNTSLHWSASLTASMPPWITYTIPAALVAAQCLALTLWMSTFVANASASTSAKSTLCLGAAVGCLLPLLQAMAVFPMAIVVTFSVVVAAGFYGWAAKSVASSDQETWTTAADNRPGSAAGTGMAVLLVLGAVLTFHAGLRIASVLMPLSITIVLPTVAMALCATAVSLISPFAKRMNQRWFLMATVMLSLVPVCFSRFVEFGLAQNANNDSVFLLTLVRSLQLFLFWLPAVLILRCGYRQICSADKSSNFNGTALHASAATVFFAAAILLTSMGLTIKAELLLSVVGFVSFALLSRVPTVGTARAASPPMNKWATWCASAMAVVLLMCVSIDTATSTQLLFNARSAQGYRLGLKTDLIEQSHSTRLLEQTNAAGDVLTVWRTSGDQVMLRRNGFPAGQISSNSQTTPQPVAEVLTTLLPLAMHRQAQSILLMGDDSGVGLQVCTAFPVHTIDAVRRDTQSTAMARKYTWKTDAKSPENDQRVSLRHQDTSICVRMPRNSGDRYDVVVAASPNPLSTSCQSELSSEFYAAVKSQLTENGVFCQRIVQHDLGAEPLIRIVSAVQEIFPRVVAVRIAAGEVAIIAGVTEDSLLDEQLLSRLQRDHVSRCLTRSGWDWSQVAALPVVDTSDPVGIFNHQQRLAASSATNAYFAFALPLEATRWGNKAGELQQTFAPHQQRMADAAPRSSAYPEFARRLSSVIQQSEILSSFPDNPWPYRKSLKMEMQRNPRPPVESVRAGKIVRSTHPLDEFRKSYFESLGQLLTQAKDGYVDPLSVREFERFTDRYEPLLSHFARHELIRIQEATGHPSPAVELRSRLHTIYFSEGRDFSIRQIGSAIQQILDDPELLATQEVRYDHVNSMLQELVRRWEVRRGYDPPSARKAQRDVDDCVRIARRALDAMEDWGGDLDISKDALKARRQFIGQALISPLRGYREQVVAHRMKNETPVAASEAPGPDDLPLLADPADSDHTLTTN